MGNAVDITIIIMKLKYKCDYTRDIVIYFFLKTNGDKVSKDKIHKDKDRQDKVDMIKLTKKHVDIVMKVNIKIDNIIKYKQYS